MPLNQNINCPINQQPKEKTEVGRRKESQNLEVKYLIPKHTHESGESLLKKSSESQSSIGSYMSIKRIIRGQRISFLNSGALFIGNQQSGRCIYQVKVLFQDVNLNHSALYGVLEIQGLTPDHPYITTYFEGEIVGPKYSFETDHIDWGASKKLDIHLWKKFPGLRRYSKGFINLSANRKSFIIDGKVYMRWKEHKILKKGKDSFSNPRLDYEGISFAGFYYTCLDLKTGKITGFYYHGCSQMYQNLCLRIANIGDFSEYEFK